MALLKAFPYRKHRALLPWVKSISKQPGCKSHRSLQLTGGGGCYPMVRLLLVWWAVWTWSCTPVLTITLPVTMPVSHPSDYLSVVGSDQQGGREGSSASAHAPMDIEKVREEEVMYHLYKNGPLGASYQRKASTVFLVELFNDLIRGLPPSPAGRKGRRAGKGTQAADTEFPLTDTIRSFSAAEVTRNPSRKTTVHFSMPYLPPNERLGSAELRFLHQSRTGRTRTKSRYKLSLVVTRGGRVMQRTVVKERAMLQREYHVFDVSRVLERWINAFHGNITLQVRLPRRLENSLLLRNASLVSTSLIALYLKDRDFLRTMYESYTTDDSQIHSNSIPENAKHPGDSSKVSGAQTFPLSRQRRESSPMPRDKRGLNRRRSKNRKNKRWYRAPKHSKCRLYDFKVDFDFIGWGQWIIHPKAFNSKFCYGSCPSPVESKFKPTNHAMLQTLMRQKKPRLAPPTCCVPTRLKPLSMLYFEYGEIVVRHHEDMIADECGCR